MDIETKERTQEQMASEEISEEVKKKKVAVKVPTSCLFGRLDNTLPNYHRVDLKCPKEREHMQKIMQYSPGVFCVFKTTARMITLKYKTHFSSDTYALPLKSKVEPVVLGLDCFGVWNVLNYIRVFEKDVEKKITTDTTLQFQVKNDQEFELFQLCFPTMSTMMELTLVAKEPIEFVNPPECKLVFVGSSVAQDNYSSNHMNICPYLYRKYGVNCTTLAVSGYHTFICDELLDVLSKQDKTCVLMDVLHIDKDIYAKAKTKFKKLVPFVIYKDRPNVNDIIRANRLGKRDLVVLPGDCMWDSVHINDYGTAFYCDQLCKRGLIPGVKPPEADK